MDRGTFTLSSKAGSKSQKKRVFSWFCHEFTVGDPMCFQGFLLVIAETFPFLLMMFSLPMTSYDFLMIL